MACATTPANPLPEWVTGKTVKDRLVYDQREKRCLPKALHEIDDERPVLLYVNQGDFPQIQSASCPSEVTLQILSKELSQIVPTFKNEDGSPRFGDPVKREAIKVRIVSIL